MKSLAKLSAAAIVTAALAPATLADGRNPGSVLIYPVTHSNNPYMTVVSVTNINTQPANPNSFGGSTNVMFEYVNTIPNPQDSQLPLDCFVIDRVEHLTPADTLSVMTDCHNAADLEGYLVITAQDPEKFKTAWKFDYLIGSELVVLGNGGTYSINAIPFEAGKNLADYGETDKDNDGRLDFNDTEYERMPDKLYIDSFVGAGRSNLVLLNLSGGTQYQAVAAFDIWNDNEFPLSATKLFRCWFEEHLADVSLVFSQDFLALNTPNDPQELDLNCDNVGDIETGWAVIEGLVATSTNNTIIDPVFLGSITAGPSKSIDGGHLLWESLERSKQDAEFLNFGVGN